MFRDDRLFSSSGGAYASNCGSMYSLCFNAAFILPALSHYVILPAIYIEEFLPIYGCF